MEVGGNLANIHRGGVIHVRDYNCFTAIASDVVMEGGFNPIYIHRSGHIGGLLACGKRRFSAIGIANSPTFRRLRCNNPAVASGVGRQGASDGIEIQSFAAGLAAYGWPVTLTDAELSERLLALNHQRAAASQQ